MRCCFNSTDPDNYSRISVTIPPINSNPYTVVTCDSFTTNCNIRVLNHRDYIQMTIDDHPYTIRFEDQTNLRPEIFADLLNNKTTEGDIPLLVNVDSCNRLVFVSNKPFHFNDITYNVKLLLGLYSVKDEDIKAEKIHSEQVADNRHELTIKSVGMYLSTPILNLVSNIGTPSFRNNTDDIVNVQSCSTILRINNSFSPTIPIVAGGNGISSIIPSGCVSGAVFILVDANMHQVDLLNPMYITLILEGVGGYEQV